MQLFTLDVIFVKPQHDFTATSKSSKLTPFETQSVIRILMY